MIRTAAELESDLVEGFEDWPCAALMEHNGRVVARNSFARFMSGVGEDAEDLPYIGAVLPGAEYMLRGNERLRFDCVLVRRYGPAIAVHVTAQPVPHGAQVYRLLVMMEREESAARGNPPALRAEDVLEALPDPTVITNGSAVVHANSEFTKLFGWSLEECVGKDMTELIVPEGRHHEREMMLHELCATGRFEMETVRRQRDGRHLDVSVQGVEMRLGGEAFGVLSTYRDIRADKREQARLTFTARHDVLTGLPNRAQFLEKIEIMLARLKRRPDREFAVIFLDLDGFKKINDTLGHAAGDDLLVHVAERLMNCLRPQDTVARFGGDEFAMLIDESNGRAEVESVMSRIQEEIQKPIDLGSHGTGYVAASMGVALSVPRHESAQALLAEADRAMYEAKVAGKTRRSLH